MNFTHPAEVDEGYDMFAMHFYGIWSTLAVFAPMTVYLMVDDFDGNAKWHNTYITYVIACYMPYMLAWWMVIFNDGIWAR